MLCVQENRFFAGGFKLCYIGLVGQEEKWFGSNLEAYVNSVVEVKSVSDGLMNLKLDKGMMLKIVNMYVLQVECQLENGEQLWSKLN